MEAYQRQTLISLRLNNSTTKNSFCGKCLFKKKGKKEIKIPHEEEMQLHRSHY